MILEFTFENSFSYKDEAYFSMEAVKGTKYKNEFEKLCNHRILKSSIIFGPNASGKSNLIKSLKTFRNLVLKKDDKKENPCPTFADNSNPVKYAVTFFAEGVIYKYSVSYKHDEIITELLEIESNGVLKTYFERKENNVYSIIPAELELLISKTRKDNLFLNTAKTFDDPHCLNVFRWFRNKLLFVSNDGLPPLDELYKLQNNKPFRKRLLAFLQAADLTIEDFEVIKTPLDFPYELKSFFDSFEDLVDYQMTLRHRHTTSKSDFATFPISLSSESEGTKKLISLAIILLSLKDSTIFIDEFDDSFHVELSKALIEVFNYHKNCNQFILTSHELALMDAGFKKEQIYFTEKRHDSNTDLYSLYDFKSEENRADYQYKKRYENGLFGAVPAILVGKLKQAVGRNE